MGKPLFIIIVVLCALGFLLSSNTARADYNFYTTAGDNAGMTRSIQGSMPNSWQTSFSTSRSNGSYYESLVGDLAGDGNTEIISASGSTTLGAYNPTTGFLMSDINIGSLTATPALCDVVGDGKREIVALARYNGTNRLLIIGYGATGLSVLTSITTSNTSNGNIVCDQFYRGRSNNAMFALWVDTAKYLHLAQLSLSAIPETVLDIDGAVGLQAAHPTVSPMGSNNVVVSGTFDPSGERAVLFTVYDHLFKYSSSSSSDDITLPFTPRADVYNSMNILGEVRDGSSTSRVLVYESGQQEQYDNGLALYKDVSNIGGTTVLQQVASTSIDAIKGGVPWIPAMHRSMALGLGYSVGGVTPVLGVIHDPEQYAFITTPGEVSRFSLFPNNLSVYHLASSSIATESAYFTYSGSANDRLYVVNGNDLIYTKSDSMVMLSTAQSNYTTEQNIMNITNTELGSGLDRYPPVPVDVNHDGFLDLLYSSPSFLTAQLTGTGSVTTTLYPFSVKQLSSGGGGAIVQVTAGFNGTNQQYRYSVACTNKLYDQFSDVFGYTFNFTGNTAFVDKVTTTVPNPNNYLGVARWSVPFTINSTFFPAIDFYSPQNTGDIKSNAVFNMVFGVNDSSYGLLLFSSNNDITDYLELTRNGGVMTVEDVTSGGRLFIGNATVTNALINMTISYLPETNVTTNQEYFVRIISIGGNSFTGTDTSGHTGTGFNHAEFAADVMVWSPGEVKYFTIQSASLRYGSNLFPPFVEFQNTIVTSDNITVPAPSDSIEGQGFTVLTGQNNVFFSSCSYDSPGIYTQRDYMAPLGVDDYTNYHDLQVVVNNLSQSSVCIGGSDCINGVCTGTDCSFSVVTTNTATGDSLNNALNRGANAAGLGTGSKLLIWLIIAVVITAVLVMLLKSHVLLAAIIGTLSFLVCFVVGIIFGWVPLWIAIVLVLVAGGIFAVFIRGLVAGSGGG